MELEFWKSVKNSSDPEDFKAYIRQFPKGQFTLLARNRLRDIAPTRSQQAAVSPARPSAPVAPTSLVGMDFGNYHALVIGNNAYRSLPRLQTAVVDAQAVAKMLTINYGFDTQLMLNATRSTMIDALARYRATLKESDNLLIYYAGHGVIDDETHEGYWLPINAERDSPSNWVSVNDVTLMVSSIRAKHVMVVSDSCYSGTLVRAAPINLKTAEDRLAWVTRMVSKRARTALVSGGLEPVIDGGGGGHSVFAKAFLDALQGNASVMGGQRLFDEIKRPVVLNSDQTPEYSDIRKAGHEGGDFMFVKLRR
jgi:hypothetical protein